MTAQVASFAPTVQPSSESGWAASSALSFASFRKPATPRLNVDVDPSDSANLHILKAMAVQLGSIIELREGWDGGRARPISPVSAIVALYLAALLVDDMLLLPQTFPLPDGGIQLEWLIDGNGLEIEISPSGEVSTLGVDSHGVTQIDTEFGAATDGRAIAAVRAYLGTIAKPLIE